jgi:hypothetical protein
MSTRPPMTLNTPVLRATLYDLVSSWAISLFAGLLVTCALIVTVWLTTRAPKPPDAVPVELVELPGGFEDGSPDETLRVDSPEPESRDAIPDEAMSDQAEIAEAIESVVEMSESATQQVQQQFETGIQNAGKVGSAKGTGRRALGIGPGTGGIPREQRWFVKFGDRTALEEYAKQLSFFGIEIGALLPDGRLAYLSDLTANTPRVRYVKSGTDEARLYMTWQGGDRRSADVQLFGKANVEIQGETMVFHFYPKETETRLAQLELEYRHRTVKQIRRTYYAVEPDGTGYKFAVFRQILF